VDGAHPAGRIRAILRGVWAFAAAYGLAYLLWRAGNGQEPWVLLYVCLVVSVWLALFLRWRVRQH
jgi:hypothetical protein